MIVQLTGTLVEVTPGQVVLDVAGVGYELGVSAATAADLPAVGSPGVTLLVRMVVREDSLTLFGFSSREERSLFDRLCAISGVGPKLALSVLSTFTPSQLAGVVAAQDSTLMAKVPGVGKRLAGRLLLELEGVFAKDAQLVGLATAARVAGEGFAPTMPLVAPAGASAVEADVTGALLAMGFTEQEASLALEGHEDAGALDVKSALEFALRRLGRR